MIALIQRVNWAKVTIDQQLYSEIGRGLLAFIAVEKNDTDELAEKLLLKILSYRVFADAQDKMNLGLEESGGDLMLVSQFTLAANTDKGLRPSFSSAKSPAEAEIIYDHLVSMAATRHDCLKNGKLASGRFAANMQIALENDGPVTFILRV
ncbi:MAG: D-tyrosyl-tRNA(Tyr) deacylase [Proteobacteria bacterium]|nr:D-tyrosyl-tRNA(Tyr) deacylase [Pseudomonadota bacterium]